MQFPYMRILIGPITLCLLTGCDTELLGLKDEVQGTKEVEVNFSAVYIVNGGDSSLSVIEAATGKLHSTISLESAMYPHHISLSPDGTKLAVAVPGMDLSGGHGKDSTPTPSGGNHSAGHGLQMMTSKVLLVDATTGKILKSRDLSTMNHNASFSPDGGEIWTSQMTEAGVVLILDPSSLETRSEIKVGRYPAEITFSIDGKKAFVANGEDDTVSVIDIATKEVINVIPVGDNPVGAWPGINNIMYVDNEAGGSISAIDAENGEVIRTYGLGFTPGMAASGPENSLWVTDTDNGKVVIFGDGSTVKDFEITTGEGAHGIAFSSDGSVAYVTNQGADTVSIIDTAKRSLISNIDVGNKPNGIIFRRQ
jgi:YVTN family beta-propeller protein